jgi:hypothetical protein
MNKEEKEKNIKYRAIGKRDKYLAVFLIRSKDSFTAIGKKRFKPDKPTVSYKGSRAFILNVSKETYSFGIKHYFFVELNEGQIGFGSGNMSISPKVAHLILMEAGIRQLTTRLSGKTKAGLWNLLIYFAFGVIAGLFIGGLLPF